MNFYNFIEDNQVKLSKKEETLLHEEIFRLKENIIEEFLVLKSVRELLYQLLDSSSSLAKFGEDYNNNKKGNNKSISDRIRYWLEAARLEENINVINFVSVNNAISCIRKAKIRFDFFESLVIDNSNVSKLLDQLRDKQKILFNSVLKLIVHVVNRYSPKNLNIDEHDCIQAASEGVLEAIRLFDHTKKTKFTTFAWIKAENYLKNYIMSNSRLVYLPQKKIENLLIILKINNKKNLSLKELTIECNKVLASKKVSKITEQEVEELLVIAYGGVQALDSSINSPDKKALSNIIPDSKSLADENLNELLFNSNLELELLNVLPELEATVLYFRYIDSDGKKRSYEEISEVIKEYRLPYDLSREKIRQIEQKALHNIKYKSSWVWNILKETFLNETLSEEEINLLYEKYINPRFKGKKELTFLEYANMFKKKPLDVLKMNNVILDKLKKEMPTVYDFVKHR